MNEFSISDVVVSRYESLNRKVFDERNFWLTQIGPMLTFN